MKDRRGICSHTNCVRAVLQTGLHLHYEIHHLIFENQPPTSMMGTSCVFLIHLCLPLFIHNEGEDLIHYLFL